MADPDAYIPVTASLNVRPSLGPIPADQVFPWAVIVLGNLVIVKSLLGMNWIITILSCGWGVATWWILTGSDSGKFLSKFHSPPFWVYGCAPYRTPLESDSGFSMPQPQRSLRGRGRGKRDKTRGRRRIQR